MKHIVAKIFILVAVVLLTSSLAQDVAEPEVSPGFFRGNARPPHHREKRQLMELISGLTSGGGDGSSLSNLIPGFSEYGPAFMSLINNFLGFMKCCGPVIIPEVVTKLLLKCSDDLTNKFFAESGFLNRTELDKKTTVFLKSPSLSGFFEAEFCAVKCVLGRMKLVNTKFQFPS